jgi:hypothetical protein
VDPLLLASSYPSLAIAHHPEGGTILKAKKQRFNWAAAAGENAEVMHCQSKTSLVDKLNIEKGKRKNSRLCRSSSYISYRVSRLIC